jgi:ankyrin repeat protein
MSRLLWILILTPFLLVLMPCARATMPYPWLNVSADPKLDRLMTAVELQDGPTLRRLLDSDVIDARVRDEQAMTALGRAAGNGWIEGSRMLLARGADPNALDGAGNTPLHNAVRRGASNAVELVDLLIRYGASPDLRGRHGATPLHQAAYFGRADVLERLLLDRPAGINAAMDGGFTALHCAASTGDATKMQMLLQYGADPCSTDSEGQTPADIARAAGSLQPADPSAPAPERKWMPHWSPPRLAAHRSRDP